MEITLSVIAIILSVISGGFALYSFAWTACRDRKQATLDAYNLLQEQALDYLNYYTPAQIAEIAQDSRSDDYKKISAYIARIEHFCVGVNQKIYDRKTVYALAHDYLDGSIKIRIQPIIERKNQYRGIDYYENIHQFYNWMERYKKGVNRNEHQTS